MTVGKAALVTAGIVGVVALGVAMTPSVREEIREQWSKATAPVAETAPTPAPEPAAAPAPKTTERRVAHRATTSPARESAPMTIAPMKKESNVVQTVAVSVWEPELRDRVKAVLNPGSQPEIAAADFANAEQFMTVAHAARNTQVPFMVLKHRVLNEGQSLAEAIHEFKPALDAKAEVQRARVAARADLEIAG